jgi:hypothetical protein
VSGAVGSGMDSTESVVGVCALVMVLIVTGSST